jgi:hypothetical protein
LWQTRACAADCYRDTCGHPKNSTDRHTFTAANRSAVYANQHAFVDANPNAVTSAHL